MHAHRKDTLNDYTNRDISQEYDGKLAQSRGDVH